MMIWLWVVCFLLRYSVFTLDLPRTTYLPTDFTSSSIKTIIKALGFIYESYEIVTEDGYIVNLNRMVNPDLRHRRDKGTPVLLVSGLGGHADSWFLQSDPLLNLPVRWLIEGYDVWLGDQRGSLRSIKHTHLPTWLPKFWDFSFHETGYYDLPAWIDFILKKTGHEKLVYSGLSDGGSFYYVLTSSRPEYQQKLHGGILWSPLGRTISLSRMHFSKWMTLELIDKFLHTFWDLSPWPLDMIVQHIFPCFVTFRRLVYVGCLLTPELLLDLVQKLQGDGGCQFVSSKKDMCVQLATAFGGTSAKYILHTVQIFKEGGKFSQYDYGIVGNMEHYNQPAPPAYDMTKLKVFTALYFSNDDAYVPNATQVPFANTFSGPVYECELDGVCHTFIIADPRAGILVDDSTKVLNQITGNNRLTTTNASQLVQLPTDAKPVTKCKVPPLPS